MGDDARPSRAAEEAARPATAADAPAIAELAAELRAATRDERGGQLWTEHDALPAPTAASVEARTADDRLLTTVGTLDGVVVAYALGHLETLTSGTILAVVDELLVAEAARAVGVGEAVLAAVTDWATAAGAIGIDATALPGNRTAKNFFESAGFTARRLVMHHKLRRID